MIVNFIVCVCGCVYVGVGKYALTMLLKRIPLLFKLPEITVTKMSTVEKGTPEP